MRSAGSFSAVSPPLGLVALSLVALLLPLVFPLLSAEVAHADSAAPTMPLSSCVGHCHGVAEWPGGNGAATRGHGVISQFLTVHLYSYNNGTNYITEEMWLIDHSHACNGYSVSWIEAGEGTQPGHTGNWYVWADCRPGYNFAPHYLYQPPGGDVGQFFEYVITWAATNTFSVAMSNLSGVQQWFGQSTAMTFQPNDIWAGLETSYTDYANNHADNDFFQWNEWETTSGVWKFQNSAGQVVDSASAQFQWVTVPAPGNNGGYGQSSCCL